MLVRLLDATMASVRERLMAGSGAREQANDLSASVKRLSQS
jgi:hypothetical protein